MRFRMFATIIQIHSIRDRPQISPRSRDSVIEFIVFDENEKRVRLNQREFGLGITKNTLISLRTRLKKKFQEYSFKLYLKFFNRLQIFSCLERQNFGVFLS